MSHPIDDVTKRYTKKLDELINVDRRLLELESLQQQKATLEAELADLRAEMGKLHSEPPSKDLKKRFEKSVAEANKTPV